MSTEAVSQTPQLSLASVSLNRRTLGVAGIISAVLFIYLTSVYGWRQGALFLVGLSAGVFLYRPPTALIVYVYVFFSLNKQT